MILKTRNLSLLILMFFLMGSVITNISCGESNSSTPSSPTPMAQSKASSLLLLQVSLRREQIANPTPERLAQMQAQGMNTSELSIQRIYIYFKQQLNQSQINELQALGITVYLDSWIPPIGNNPDGFYLADMPVDKLDQLAAKDYVVRLDTAEKQLQPQSGQSIGG